MATGMDPTTSTTSEAFSRTQPQSQHQAREWIRLRTPSPVDGAFHPSDDESGNEPSRMRDEENVESVESVVEFSIGRRQTYLRCPKTPAEEKEQAIAQPSGDLNSETHDEPFNVDSNPVRARDPAQEEEPQGQSPACHSSAPVPAAAATQTDGPFPDAPSLESSTQQQHQQQHQQQRSEVSRSFLRDSIAKPRARTSSGSSMVADSFRRFLAEFPSIPLSFPKGATFPSFNSRAKLGTNSDDADGLTKSNLPGGLPGKEAVEVHGDLQRPFSPSEKESSLHSPPHVSLLRRATSDNSLYIRKELSRTPTLEDTAMWGDVSEQVNSRFKAIRDSLQESRIRIPKMPSINLGPLRPSASASARPNSDIARHNAPFNTGLTDGLLSLEGKLRAKSEAIPPSHHPTETHHAHPILNHSLSKLTGDVIVLGGYRGSILRSAKPPHRQLWIPVKVGLNLRKVDLEVGVSPEDEELMEDSIIPSGVLSHIGPVDICRRLLRHLKHAPNRRAGKLRVHNYGYDWRLSPSLLSRNLIEFLEKLACNLPNANPEGRGATVIAHSLGGLITRHAVNQRPDLFAGVLYAGVPQHCVNILGPLRNGDAVLLSSRVLTAQVNFTMRTSYVLLPEDGRCFLDKQTGERYDVDFFNPDNWDEYRLSPCINPPLPSLQQDHRKSLADVLSDSLPSLPQSVRPSGWALGREPPEASTGKAADAARDLTSLAADDAARYVSRAEQSLAATHESGIAVEPWMSPAGQKVKGGVATACSIPRPVARAYLARTLASVLQFKRELAFQAGHQEGNRYPPMAVMFGKGVPTVFGAKVAGREGIKREDAYDDLAFASGDGVVLARAAMLPHGYRCVKGGHIESDRGHIGLLGDLEGVGKALQAIIEARAKGIGCGRDAMERPTEA